MKMQFAYGIYEGEIEGVLAAVRAHRPLSEIEGILCPCCGAGIVVQFSPEGNGFQVNCCGSPPHLSTYQEITTPPPWWKERICETGPITFYWREWSRFTEGGSLEMKVSGYEADGSHWTGALTLEPNQTDYMLWRWIISQGDRFKPLLSDKDLEAIRQEYRRSGGSEARANGRREE
jgi:hypothetical protein